MNAKLAEKIESTLRRSGRPIPLEELAWLTGATPRSVRRSVASLVAEGIPILRTREGYVYSLDPRLLLAGARRATVQAAQLLVRASALERLASGAC